MISFAVGYEKFVFCLVWIGGVRNVESSTTKIDPVARDIKFRLWCLDSPRNRADSSGTRHDVII